MLHTWSGWKKLKQINHFPVFSESHISLNIGLTPLLHHQCFGGINKMPKGQLNALLLKTIDFMSNKHNVLDFFYNNGN